SAESAYATDPGKESAEVMLDLHDDVAQRPVRGSVRCRSISALYTPRRSSNARGRSKPASEVTVAELDAKLGIEREANRVRSRVAHPMMPSQPARRPGSLIFGDYCPVRSLRKMKMPGP